MTVVCFTSEQFFEYLRNHGCNVVDESFYDTYNRVIVEVNGETFPMQCLPKYFYPVVVQTCELMGIPAPEDHLHAYWQHFKRDHPCHCGSGTAFKDCHGNKS